MADDAAQAELKRKRTFRKFTYRGVDLDQLLDMNSEQLMELYPCRIRRKFSRGLKVVLFLFVLKHACSLSKIFFLAEKADGFDQEAP